MKPCFPGRTSSLAAVLFSVLATSAAAHPGHDDGHELTWDFTGGLVHPFGGFDHVLALLAVGMWAMQLGGRARQAVPLVFVAAMTLVASLGRAFGGIDAMQQALAAYVLVLGLLLAGAARLPLYAGLPLVASFALANGLAHGAKIPGDTSGLSYGAGFLVSTIALLAAGMVTGHFALRRRPWLPRAAGLVVMVVGIGFCLS